MFPRIGWPVSSRRRPPIRDLLASRGSRKEAGTNESKPPPLLRIYVRNGPYVWRRAPANRRNKWAGALEACVAKVCLEGRELSLAASDRAPLSAYHRRPPGRPSNTQEGRICRRDVRGVSQAPAPAITYRRVGGPPYGLPYVVWEEPQACQ